MSEKFFLQDVRVVARELLGRELIRKIGERRIRGIITETEAYCGLRDKGSHVYRGRTKRNEPMFGPPGTIYVYLIYGMYYCINFVTGPRGKPSAVLIRGIRMLDGNIELNGPGKVTRAFGITKFLNNKNILHNDRLMLGRRVIEPIKIIRTPRIGIPYAEEWAARPLRFVLAK